MRTTVEANRKRDNHDKSLYYTYDNMRTYIHLLFVHFG